MQSLFENTVTNLHADYQKRIGWVTVNNGKLYMQNLSGKDWVAFDPDSRKTAVIRDKQGFPVKAGTQIMFSQTPKIVGVIDDPRKT